MPLTTCSECGGKVSDKAAVCPHCGCPVASGMAKLSAPAVKAPVPLPVQNPSPQQQPTTRRKMIGWVLGVALGGPAVAWIICHSGEERKPDASEKAWARALLEQSGKVNPTDAEIEAEVKRNRESRRRNDSNRAWARAMLEKKGCVNPTEEEIQSQIFKGIANKEISW